MRFSKLQQTEFLAPENSLSSNMETEVGPENCHSNEQCPPALALHTIELSLKEGVIDKYVAAYSVNHHDFSDPIYMTWKLYKDKCFYCGSVDKQSSDEKVTSVQQVKSNQDTDMSSMGPPHQLHL